eukprot:3754044-Rhodomonas_salina.1
MEGAWVGRGGNQVRATEYRRRGRRREEIGDGNLGGGGGEIRGGSRGSFCAWAAGPPALHTPAQYRTSRREA